MMKSILFLTLACFCLSTMATSGRAQPTSRCHCFRDRVFDPATPFAADDYLLTTSFTSLIAATLGISKRQIIMMKMKDRIDPETLLIAAYIAKNTRSQLNLLLSIHDNGGSWQRIVGAPSLQKKAAQDTVLSSIAKGLPDRQISQLVADQIVSRHYGLSAATIQSLRRQGFSSKEINLLCALHTYKNRSFQHLITMRQTRQMSWSAIANSLQLTPKEMGIRILTTVNDG